MSKDYAKALARSMQQVKGVVAANVYSQAVYTTFDISEPNNVLWHPELDTAETEALVNLWRVKFGDGDVSHYSLARGDSQWKTIAHVLWKRNAIVDLNLINSILYPGSADNNFNPVRERLYKLR